MKIYIHVIRNDVGLAPNPFYGYCTSALCTPSHMKAKLQGGDWLIGNSPVADGNWLVYAMRISEVLSMEEYFEDRRFERKKPNPKGSLIEQCGDNFYYKDAERQWRRLPSHFHNENEEFAKDLGREFAGRPVFVSQHFFYFGNARVSIPGHLQGIIKDSQGISKIEGALADNFVSWLASNYQPGVIGEPKDFEDRSNCSKPMLTRYQSEKPRRDSSKGCGRQSVAGSFRGRPGRSRGCQ